MSKSAAINDRLEAGRSAWSRRPGLRRTVVLLPVALAVVAGLLYLVSADAYLLFVREYSVVENAQVLFYLAGALLALLLAARLTGERRRGLAVIYVVGAVGLVFIAGEEISWGQELWERIIPGFPSSEDLQAVNAQGETTLHNLHGVGRLTNILFAVVAVYGLGTSLVDRVRRSRGAARPYLAFPAETAPAFAVAAAFFVLDHALGLAGVLERPFSPAENAFLRFQEVAEAAIAVAIALHVWLLLVDARRGARHRDGAPGA